MRSYKRWGMKFFKSGRVFKFRFGSSKLAYIWRIDLFHIGLFVVYRRNGLEEYYRDISYGYL